jgi:ankyrin
VRRRNPETTRFLLEKGADPRTFNLTDMAPLHIAALNGQNELVELFLEQPGMIDLRNEDDRTAFDHALRSRKYETVQLLVDHGAAIDRVMKNGYTATHLMVIAKDYQAARFLIEAGADIHLAGPSGETAYELIRNKQLQILLDLVEVRDNPPGVAHTNTVHSIE